MTVDQESFVVDLANREDIRIKLPRARHILDRKRREAERAKDEYAAWFRLVDMLANIAGVPREEVDSEDDKARSDADLVVGVVERVGQPIRARDVADVLRDEGHEISNEA